jgi:hypothetical protein
MIKSDENWHSIVDSFSSAALDEAFEGHGRAVLTAVHDSLSIPLFICDRNGGVRNLRQAASEAAPLVLDVFAMPG